MESAKAKRLIATVLTVVMAAVLVVPGTSGKSLAAKKTKLKAKKVSVSEGKAKRITILGKKAKHTYTFASKNKKVAKVSKKGMITGVKAGRTTITVRDEYKQKGKKKKKTLGKVTVTVTPKTVTAKQTMAPPAATQTPPQSSTSAPTEPPTETPIPTETPDPISNLWPAEWSDDYTTPTRFNRQETDVEYGEMKEITYHSETTGTDRKANVLLPAGYDESKQYPVIYLLHGVAGDHNEWGTNPKRVIGNLIASGEVKEMIAVMPNVRAWEKGKDPGPNFNVYSIENFKAFDNFINDLRDDLMPYMKAHYSIAEGRENTAIAGLSMGGRESLYIGLSMPETFGYVGCFEPAVGVLPYATEEGLFTEDTLKLPDEYNGKNVLLIQKGTKDTTVGDSPLLYHNTLTNNGTKHEYFEVEMSHEMGAWANGLYNFVKRVFAVTE